MRYFLILLFFLSSCAPRYTDWDYNNNNPYKKKFKHKPNYKDYNYGHRPGQWKSKHKKKNKIRY
jgi:hypothetical protein